MKNRSNEGILYPKCIEVALNTSKQTPLPALFVVQRKSYNYIENELSDIFSGIGLCQPEHIFVFSALHDGPIGFDDAYTIYTDSDCPVEDPILTKDDDICSEEFGAEILTPFFDKLFPNVPVNQFLAPEKNKNNEDFFNRLVKNYKNSLIFISKNQSEDSLWPQSLQG